MAHYHNFAIFFDGTCNDHCDETNVYTMCKELRLGKYSFDGESDSYYTDAIYEAGPGTTINTILLGGLFAEDLGNALTDVYPWICEKILNLNRDEPETKPQIFIFGFSRGAYRAHAFSWLLQTYGIPLKYTACRPVAKAFIDHNDNVIPTLLKDGVLPSPEITMLGLWDIVSAPLDAKKHYNDGCRPPKVLNIYHAMAANERRLNFPVLQYSPHGKGIEQMWFPGAHSDVGGGYPVNERALSNQCYNWMKEKAYNLGLDFLVPPKKIKNHTAIIGNLNEMHDESLPLTPNNREFLSGERVHKNVKNMMHYFKNYTTFVNDFPSMRFSRYFNL